MAKIKTSALVADIKGKVGGNVFASNKGGNYVRRNKKPTDLNSIKQQSIRANFATIAMNWRLLTEQARQSWISGAVNFPYQDSLGETRILSGQQLYMKLNNNLIQRGLTVIDFCPVPQSFPSIVILGCINEAATNKLTLNLECNGDVKVSDDYYLTVTATAALSAGISSPQISRFKQIGVYGPGTSINNLSIIGEYSTNFGALLLGETIFIGVTLTSGISGESSISSNLKSTRLA